MGPGRFRSNERQSMATSYQHPYPDPEIAALVARLTDRMNDLAQRRDELLPALQAGKSLAELDDGSPEDEAKLRDIAMMLCEKGEYRHALPIALYLTSHHGEDHRHAFMAGTCMRRLGHPQEALAMYGLSMLIAGHPQVAAMYRAGECLLALGNKEHALQAFEEAFDLGRSDSQYRNLQDAAGMQIKQLRAA